MRSIKFVVLAGFLASTAAPAFASAASAAATHGTWVAKKKKKDEAKCDAAGSPCKEGDDCKAANCKPAEPAPAPAPGGAPQG